MSDPTVINPETGRDGYGRFAKGASGNPSGVSKAIAATRQDGWSSALTGIGSASLDKRLQHTFSASRSFTYQELIEMWRGDDLAARAIEGPPADAFRQGYEIVIGDESKYEKLKEEVEEKLEELDVDNMVERLFAMDRALGGAVLLLGADDGQELDQPLKIDRVKGIEWLTLLEPMEIQPHSYYENPKDKKYGEPKFYELNTYQAPGSGVLPPEGRSAPPNQHLIHESRLIVLRGIQVSRYQISRRDVGQFWGDSVLARISEILRDFNIAWQSAGIIVTDFSQAVYQIENLMQLVAKSPEKLRARMQALELARSTARAVLIDTKEKFDRQTTNISGLPDLLEKLSLRLAAAIDMPLSLLMGQAPKGLGADSEGDLRMYYDKIRSFQRRKISPLLKIIITMVMKSMRERGVPKKWEIKFNPLWQLTDAEIAEARLTQARTDSLYVKSGALHPDEIRNSRWKGGYSYETQIDESEPAPGFLSPLPAGVLPGSTPNVGGGSKSAKPQGPNAHSVTSYARRNPSGMGGDSPPRDSANFDGTETTGAYLEKRADKWTVVSFEGVDIADFVKREDAVRYLTVL
jgi:phage-related protein (TIGR01555 family)